MSWQQIVLFSIIGDLLGAICTYAWASYKHGQIVPEQYNLHDDDYGFTQEQHQMRSFYEGCKDFALAWPIQLIAAIGYWVFVRGIGEGLDSLQTNMKEHGKANSERKLLNIRQERYDELWNKRNQLPYGHKLNQAERREMKTLAEIVGERPDTREPSMDQLHEMAIEMNQEWLAAQVEKKFRKSRPEPVFEDEDPIGSLEYEIFDRRHRPVD